MKRNHIKLLVCLGACLIGQTSSLQAQKDLPTETVEIIKDFDVRLLESEKIGITPQLPPVSADPKQQTYSISPQPLSLKYEAPTLRPVGLKREKNEEVYKGYAKLGAGVPLAFYGEAGYAFGKKNVYDFRAWVKHHSVKSGALENQRFMNNDAAIGGTYFLTKNTAIDGNLGYSYDRIHYYGYDHNLIELSEEGTRQNYKLFNADVRLYNSERSDLDLNYFIQPKFYYLTDFFTNKETGFDFKMGATKWFSEKHPFRIVLRTDFTNFNDTATYTLNNVYIQPSFTLHFDRLKLKLGANFASNRDLWHIFPDAELTVRVVGDGLQVFGGATGDLRKNTYRSLTEYSPWLVNDLDRLSNTKYQNYYGGIKGDLGWLDYSVQGGYAISSRMALFQPVFTKAFVQFQPLYDSVQIVNFQGQIKLKPNKNLDVTGTLSQSIFEPSRQAKAWGIPGLEGNFGAIYRLLEGKASAKAELYLADKISYKAQDGLADKSGALIDLNIGGTYQITKNFGAFLDLNNVLNNKRERWHAYPTLGMNVLGGITIKF
jgi:hypothetical protein